MEAVTRSPAANQQNFTQAADQTAQVVFREIYKNAWLRRISSNSKNSAGGAYPKRGENVWVVFCVHDDREPFLEVYLDQKVAISHRPDWCAPLATCLHISPTICAAPGDQYEFVITLRNGVIKLAATSWDIMMDWVNSLRSKLVEMKILSPQENVYTQAPQAPRFPLLPTRDPNSPLPPTPAGPLAIVPGTELPPQQSADRVQSDSTNQSTTTVSVNFNPRSETSAASASPRPSTTQDSSTNSNIFSRSISVNVESGQNVTVIELEGPSPSSAPSGSGVFNFDVISSTISDTELSQYERLYLGHTSQTDPNEPMSPLLMASEQPETSATPSNPPERQNESEGNSVRQAPPPPRSEERRPTLPPGRVHDTPRRKRGPRLDLPRRPLLRPPMLPPVLTLREQQVLEITREIRHPGGVRLQLRKKDCISSVAFVDAFGAVWIAGWKQKVHPHLYNALHIGDRVLSVTGVLVPNASEANNLIKACCSPFIEIIVRRVPFGRVFAIRKDVEGQDVGLELEGSTAEIKSVRHLSPAARAGVPPKAPSCDGLSLCNWVLTEVNSRPLNLFFKDSEVRDRLNAVGRDMSILIHPFDLIKQIKKQLKSIKNYKEYLVQ
ncbi:uncharacterized protein LOC132197280 [Neocloeon triangulifer]|uniref:uncharacterized protein LOC132197280 n=1 Tax=Neocloeon triangulifer TaxID=2078957 RepID=UPI00286EF7A9|nr:uncharacterized protein LOC132197280 [Neocloeon triangulifer]